MRYRMQCGVAVVSLAGALASPAAAFTFQTRFVERVGNTDTVLGSSTTFVAGSTHRIRIQLGVFDDAAGAAPAGGVAGWNTGTMTTTIGSWSRTPGRIAPFTFSPHSYSNGVPEADPFTALTQIDAAMGFQAIPWMCDENTHEPLPMPQPVIRGLNSFVSTFEATVQIPSNVEGSFSLTIGGQFIALREWRLNTGLTLEPDCETETPGVAWWDPLIGPGTSAPFTNTLGINVIIPSPGAAALLGLGVLGCRRRR